MTDPQISVVIPALNEAATVARVVATFLSHPNVSEVIVIDNNSTDATTQEASRAGARVIECRTPGAGAAVTVGLRAAANDWVFKCDGDIRNPQAKWIDVLVSEISEDVGLIKGNWHGPEDDLPVTNLVVKPGLKLFFPELAYVEMPITGLYLVNRTSLIYEHLFNDFSFDLQVAVQVHILGRKIRQVYLGDLLHRQKSSSEYTGMAVELFSYMVRVHGHQSAERVLVMADTCEEAFLWSGGTILKYLLAGANVTITSHPRPAQGSSPIAEFLGRFANFHHREWDVLANCPSPEIADQRDEFSIGLFPPSAIDRELSAVLAKRWRNYTAPFTRYFLYTDHMHGGITHGDRPVHSVDISAVAPLKHRILAALDAGGGASAVRVCQLSDEINGLRCGTAFAELFAAVPCPGPSQAGNFL